MRVATALLTACFLLAAAPIPAQTSIGFSDPSDLDALLAYRLPDWGYRTWDATLDFQGSGRSGRQIENRNNLHLGTSAGFFRESERRVWEISAFASGSLAHNHLGTEFEEVSSRSLTGSAVIAPDLSHYLGSSEFFVLVGADLEAGYNESRRDDGEETTRIGRRYRYGISGGIGLGRVRDVTPLIRAKRISERLVALGRAPLTDSQVVEIAQVLAQEGGYRIVFDRADRHFWRDVLEPLLDPGRPLAVYEVEYLEEVLLESVGSRRQGQLVQLVAGWNEDQWSSIETQIHTERFAGLLGQWVRNLSLTQQIEVLASASYRRAHDYIGPVDRGYARFRVAYLNNISDRNRLDLSLTLDGNYDETELWGVTRVLVTRAQLTDRFYIEDRVVLRPFAALIHYSSTYMNGEDQGHDTRWQYGLSLDYYFDRLLY